MNAVPGSAASPALRVRQTLAGFWKPPPHLPETLKAEYAFVPLRWLGITAMVPGLALAGLSSDRLLAAYLILVAAAIYNLSVRVLLFRRPSMLASGYLTQVADSLLTIAMLLATGGFDTPFYYILYTITVSAALRYGFGPALAVALLAVSLDALEALFVRYAIDAAFVVRSAFLLITASLAGYLRQRSQRAEARLQRRFQQANLLNQATGMLGASLDPESLLYGIAAAASHLFGGRCAVVRLAAGALPAGRGLPAEVHYCALDSADDHPLLVKAAQRSERRRTGRQNALMEVEPLPGQEWAIVLDLPLLAGTGSLGVLAIASPSGQRPILPDEDVLESFADRVALTIENASTYQKQLLADEIKTNFLSNVSHELRTPLTSIHSFSELLLSYDDPEVRHEFGQIINSESQRLIRLVNDLFEITRIESGEMDWHFGVVDLRALLEELACAQAAAIEDHDLTFEREIAPDLPPVYGDRDRLVRAVESLLDNARKFTPRGSIRLRARQAGDEVHVAVADTGIGIAPAEHERIFEKFQQVGELLTDKPAGTGLGLTLCRDIVEYHRGRVWVESEPGKGSTFTVALPAISTDLREPGSHDHELSIPGTRNG